jgi:hypothetical protein
MKNIEDAQEYVRKVAINLVQGHTGIRVNMVIVHHLELVDENLQLRNKMLTSTTFHHSLNITPERFNSRQSSVFGDS